MYFISGQTCKDIFPLEIISYFFSAGCSFLDNFPERQWYFTAFYVSFTDVEWNISHRQKVTWT